MTVVIKRQGRVGSRKPVVCVKKSCRCSQTALSDERARDQRAVAQGIALAGKNRKEALNAGGPFAARRPGGEVKSGGERVVQPGVGAPRSMALQREINSILSKRGPFGPFPCTLANRHLAYLSRESRRIAESPVEQALTVLPPGDRRAPATCQCPVL